MELNAVIEQKLKKNVKNKKRRKTEKELQHFQDRLISDDEDTKNVSSMTESVEIGEKIVF